MDDFPAGPASPGPRRHPLAVVVPVRNGGDGFERCLRGLRDSSLRDYELIVVDDDSTDGSADRAEAAGARTIRLGRRSGPAAARNAGARAAQAPILFFLDADVVVHPEALRRALDRLGADPGLAALFGSYDDRPADPGLVSQFRNLLHHYTHQSGSFVDDARPAHTFWTGCGAIRREVFLSTGGFDPDRYRRPAIEDVELGYRLVRDGHRIALVRTVLATHLKRWTLGSMVRTDVFGRGVPWALLMLRSRVAETDLNLRGSQRASVLATALTLLGLAVAPLDPRGLMAAAIGALGVVALNAGFYGFLRRVRGLRFALAVLPLHLVYFASCAASLAIAVGLWLTTREPAPAPARATDRGPVGARRAGSRTTSRAPSR